ncbi:pentapeptide repeat-containing protein [Actinoplanes sp. GCM10030250]|uniref:WD40 domain-containing protein n=1 Tax=Actinoplanes sp. GCM10030250 TaxID=3273376 RepID=UPI0036243188
MPVNAPQPIMILHCRDFLATARKIRSENRSPSAIVEDVLDQLKAPGATASPDLVVITGNLAERATPGEYEIARQLLSALRDTLGLDHRRIVLVPGTSDVNRLKCQAYFLECQGDEKEPAPPYWEKWQPFSTMLSRFHGTELPRDEPWSLTEFPDLRVVVAGFNSTMALSHLPQDEHGLLGPEQLDWFADRLSAGERGDWLRIGVLHHRPDGRDVGAARLADADRFAATLAPHLDLVVHGQPDEPAVSRLAGEWAPIIGGSAAWQLIETHGDHVRVRALPAGPHPAGSDSIALPHPAPRRPDTVAHEPAQLTELQRVTDQVAEVCRLRFPDAEVTLVPQPDSERVAYLRISPDRANNDRGPAEQHPIGVCAPGPGPDDIEWFARVLDRFRTGGTGRTATLVHAGPPAGKDLIAAARGRGITLVSFADFQLGPDLDRFAERQAAALDSDPVYPPASYVPQRYTEFLPGPRAPSEAPPSTDLLAWLRDWVDAPEGRLVVVLGTFGHGKTFLLHELARRMHDDGSRTVPVLIDLRGFEKAYSLDELIAVQLSRHGQRQIDLDAFRYLRREGRVALLFDGFDELATRVSYDRATNHLDTIVQAAEDRAKVILTSRDQHFLTDADVLAALGAQFGAGRRLVRLADFDDHQILSYLTHHLRDPARAERRLEFLREVKDLLGLSRNPRMLSFITDLELGEEPLPAPDDARDPITAAELYRQVIERWLRYERDRLKRLGPRAPDEHVLMDAVTLLALRLWDSPDDSLSRKDLGTAAATLSDLTVTTAGEAAGLEPEESAHLLGSSTLLVRSGEGRFTFVHHSVREWLIARHIARQLTDGGGASPGLVGKSMPPLMIDFLCDLAGHDFIRNWAEEVLAVQPTARGMARNAMEILAHIGVPFAQRLNMPGQVLRGKDFSGQNLARADLSGADLTNARLVGTNLQEANLNQTNLAWSRIDQASLRDADLTAADLTGARMLGTDLTGANLTRTRLRRAAMVAAVGTDADELRSADTLGAALPGVTTAEPQIASSAVVNAVAVSSAVRLLAGGGEDGVVRIWDAANGFPLRVLPGHTGPVRAVAFTADGRCLASAGDDDVIRIWDIATGRTVRELTGHSSRIRSLAYSPDGGHLAGGGEDEKVRVWNTATGRTVHTLTGHSGGIRCVAYRPGGQHLASAGEDESVRIWDTATGRTEHTLIRHTGTIHAIAWAPTGDRIASASDDRQIYLWDVAAEATVQTMAGHRGWVRTLSFSAEGRRLASAGDDGTIRIWDSDNGRTVHTLTGHTGLVHSVAYYQDGPTLASAGSDRTVRMWDTVEGHGLRTLRGSAEDSRSLCFSPRRDDPWLAVGSDDGSVRIWSPVAGEQPRVLRPPGNRDVAVSALAVSPDARHLACSGPDGSIRIWDLTTDTLVTPFLPVRPGAVHSIAFAPGGRHLASGGADDMIYLWDVVDGVQAKTFAGRHGAVTTLAFTPDGSHLASGGRDGTVKIWPLGGQSKRQIVVRHANQIQAIAFSPDGRRLASADEDGTIRIRSTVSREAPLVLSGHSGSVHTLAFSPDGKRLASAGTDGTIRIWTVETGLLAVTLAGRTGWIHSLSYSPDGRHLACTGGDRAIRIWDTVHNRLIALLVPLAAGGSAVLLDDQYMLDATTSGEYWYAIGMCRFEPGELDPYLPQLNWAPAGARLW